MISMGFVFWLLLFAVILFLLSEPLYVSVQKQNTLKIEFHLIFLSLTLTFDGEKQKGRKQKKKKNKISATSYLKSWVKLRKRVKIKIDSLYFPIGTSAYVNALVCGLYPPYRRGIERWSGEVSTRFLIHIETTLFDCLLFLVLSLYYQKKKEQKELI